MFIRDSTMPISSRSYSRASSLLYLQRRLQSVLNAAARLMFRLRRYHHVTDAHATLHWLRLSERVDLSGCCGVSSAAWYVRTYVNQLVRIADLPGRCRLRSSSTHTARSTIPSIDRRLSFVSGRCIRSLQLSGIGRSVFSFSTCLPSTTPVTPLPRVFS